MRLILASASPRRLHLLRSIGLSPQVRPVDLDEAPLPSESPQAMVLRLACAKAALAAAAGGSTGALILAADTTVAVDGRSSESPRAADGRGCAFSRGGPTRLYGTRRLAGDHGPEDRREPRISPPDGCDIRLTSRPASR
jgi:hypothetical protein